MVFPLDVSLNSISEVARNGNFLQFLATIFEKFTDLDKNIDVAYFSNVELLFAKTAMLTGIASFSNLLDSQAG